MITLNLDTGKFKVSKLIEVSVLSINTYQKSLLKFYGSPLLYD